MAAAMIAATQTPSGAAFSPDRVYRYALWRNWRPWDLTSPQALVIGLNPSTADETIDDPTIRRCIGFAKRWGARGLVMANLFAVRATDPCAMRAHASPVGLDNEDWLRGLATICSPVVAAWGVHGTHRGRCDSVQMMLRADHRPVMCLGRTKDGHPKHPLYLPNDAELTLL